MDVNESLGFWTKVTPGILKRSDYKTESAQTLEKFLIFFASLYFCQCRTTVNSYFVSLLVQSKEKTFHSTLHPRF